MIRGYYVLVCWLIFGVIKIINMKYQQNLQVIGSNVYSYRTLVATIEGSQLRQLGYWSMTTQKHINYIAKEFNLTLVKP